MNTSKKFVLLVLVLVLTNIIWGVGYFGEKNERRIAEIELAKITQNKKIAAFQKLFVDKVLMANGEVDFDTRVELQNSARDTGDQAVIEAWNNFLSSKTESEGQKRVKELLSLFASRIYIK